MGEMAHVLLDFNRLQAEGNRARQKVSEEQDDMERYARGRPEAFNIELYRMHHHYINRLESENREAQARLEQIRPDLEREQQKVTEARKQKRIVEILKEREKSKHNEQIRKAERKELEESNRKQFQNNDPFSITGATDETAYRVSSERGTAKPGDSYYGESETPERKKDYVDEYFKNMGMDPPGKKNRDTPLDPEDNDD